MRIIPAGKITDTVAKLCMQANLLLRRDVVAALMKARRAQTNRRARHILEAIIENARLASAQGLAICQDTGLPVVFVEYGQDIRVRQDLMRAIQRGVALGYRRASLRKSVIRPPLSRSASTWGPAVIHVDVVKGSRLKITVLPKGFGCENKSALKMFKPTAPITEIKQFIIDTVKAAGPDACPPYVVGVGMGGTADYASLLAKKALLRPINRYTLHVTHYTKLERDLLRAINHLNIGPMGLGGKTTALAVNIETYPTHIAGLPVAVNISCHALRSATATL
jgi:fumarate hydratase subunit alpha